MEKFECITGGLELLPLVKPLWEKLNYHHRDKSNNFKEKYQGLTFEKRVEKFSKAHDFKINIDLIMDNNKGEYIGYCISTINSDFIGEVDSLYLSSECRGHGLGDELMERSMKWIHSNGAKSTIIGVADGNEEVLKFYERYGFKKRTIILERVQEC